MRAERKRSGGNSEQASVSSLCSLSCLQKSRKVKMRICWVLFSGCGTNPRIQGKPTFQEG